MVDVVATQYLPAPGGEVADYIQRFTFPQSGEVKGCLVTTVPCDQFDQTVTAGFGFSFGFSDGTDDYAFSGSIEDTTRQSFSRLVNDRVLVGLSYGSADDGAVNLEVEVDSMGLVAGTNTGYVDLKWITPPASSSDNRPVAVTVFAGSGVLCKALDVETSAVVGGLVAVPFGFKPTFGFGLTNHNSFMEGAGVLPSTDPNATRQSCHLSLGIFDASSDASPNQKSVTWRHAYGTSFTSCTVENLLGANVAPTGASSVFEGSGAKVVNLDSAGCDLELTNLGDTDDQLNFAMFGVQLENASAKVTHQTTPISTGTGSWSQETRSQAVIVLPTKVATVGTPETGFAAGPFGVSLADRQTQLSYTAGFEDGSNDVFCRVSDDKLVHMPNGDGTLGTDHFNCNFTGFGGHPSFVTGFNFVGTDTSSSRSWPTLHIGYDDPANFNPSPAQVEAVGVSHKVGDSAIEYFDGGSAGTLLTGVVSNSGTLTVDSTNEIGIIDCSNSTTDVAYWYDKLPVQKDRTWCVRATIRFDEGTIHPDVFSIINLAGGPVAPTSLAIGSGHKRIQCGLVDDGGAVARVGYFPGASTPADPLYGLGRFWNESTEAWTTSSVPGNTADIASVRKGATEDFYTFSIFNRGDTQEFCILIQNTADATNLRDDRQGEIALQTKWVKWSNFSAATNDLWVVLGQRYTNESSLPKYSVHMYERDWGGLTTQRGSANCKDDLSEDYVEREIVGSDRVWVLAKRDTLFYTDSETYGDEGIRKRSHVIDDDGTIYKFYEAFDTGGPFGPSPDETRIKRTTSIDGGLTWSAPVTVLAPTDVNATGYKVVTGIQMLKWNDHPTPGERCMLFVTAEVDGSTKSEHRMFVFTAADLSATSWTKKSGSGTHGAIFEGVASDTAYNHSGHGDPVVSRVGSTWHMMLSSLHSPATPTEPNPVQGWQISHATSADAGTPINWTIQAGAPHIASTAEGIRTATAVSGSNVTVTPTSEFVKHAVVKFRRDNTDQDEYGVYRIRRVNAGSLDLLQEVVGMSPMTSDSSIAVIGTGSITPHATRILSSGLVELLGTAFQGFIRGVPGAPWTPAGIGNCEFTARWTSTDYENWTIDFAHSPVLLITGKAGRNIENISVFQATLGQPTEIAVDPIPTINRSKSTVTIPAGLELIPVTTREGDETYGYDSTGLRYTVSDVHAETYGWSDSINVDARIEVALLSVSLSASAVSLPDSLELLPAVSTLDDLPLLVIGSSGSTVTIPGGIDALGLIPSLDPDDIPLLLLDTGGSKVNQGVLGYMELDNELNVYIVGRSCVTLSGMELQPTCGKVEDMCDEICLVDIWNGALVALGLPTFTDQNANNKYFNRIRLVWTRVRKELIREGIFNGTTDRRDLVEITNGADHRSDYDHAYELPSCFIKAISINGKNAAQEGAALFALELAYEQNRIVLYTNESTCQLHYTMDIFDVNLLDPSTMTALVNMLALEIAPAFKKPEEVEALRQRYEAHVLEARATDTQENSPEEFEDYTDALFWNS